MTNTYLIDDQYFKKKYPSMSTYDNNDILTVILMEQETSLASDMTEELYADLIGKLEAGEVLDEAYAELLAKCQSHMVFLTVKGLYSFYNKKESEDVREYNISNIYGKLKYTQKKLIDFIDKTDFTSTGSSFSSETYNYSPITYLR